MTAVGRDAASPHVVVVGAGIVGATIAFELALRGVRLTVLDAGEPGHGVSAVSFSWLNAADKNPRHYSDLSRRALDGWDRFARRLGDGVGPTWGGELRWVTTAKGADELAARVRKHQAIGYPIRLVDPAEAARLEPALATGPIAAASFAELEGHVDAVRVVAACLARAAERGAEVRPHTPVTALRMERRPSGGAHVAAVAVADGEIPCDVVVLAGGPDGAALAAHAGLAFPLNATFGATLVTDPVPPLFRRAAVVQTPRDLDARVSIRQLPDGTVMIHGPGSGEGSLGKTDAEVAHVFETAKRFVPALGRARIAEVRKGRRPIPGDGHPVVGFATAAPNVYLAVMHNAVTLAPLVAELAAIELLDGVRVDVFEPYRIERFT
jgi:glycine/D-amino acid oxidase-like deaminating enzyme